MESKISVIIPTYNDKDTLNVAIKSVFAQSYTNIELIIVDDGSDYDVETSIRHNWPDKDVMVIKQKNMGPAAARNAGIQKSTGNYIAFLDSDDEWFPEHLTKCLTFMFKGKFDWVATGYYNKYPDGRCTYNTFSENSHMYDKASGKVTLLKQGLFWFSSIPLLTNTLLFQKDCLLKLQGFDISFRIGEDWDLYLKAEEAGFSCGFLDEATTYYNYNPNSITKNKQYDLIYDHLRVAKRHANILGRGKYIIKKSYSDFVWHAARNYLSLGKYSKAVKYSLLSLSIYFDINKLISLFKTRLTM